MKRRHAPVNLAVRAADGLPVRGARDGRRLRDDLLRQVGGRAVGPRGQAVCGVRDLVRHVDPLGPRVAVIAEMTENEVQIGSLSVWHRCHTNRRNRPIGRLSSTHISHAAIVSIEGAYL